MKRIVCLDRPPVAITVNGQALSAHAGDTVLTALVSAGLPVRESEFTTQPRAGFCLMGACQDCWVRIDGKPARACSTVVRPDMAVSTRPLMPESA